MAEIIKPEQFRGRTDDERARDAFMNPIIPITGGLTFRVRKDGAELDILKTDTGELIETRACEPMEYLMLVHCGILERKIDKLRMKYEPETVDLSKMPSDGVSLDD